MHELKFRFWDEVNKRFWCGGQEGESIGKETFQTYFKDGALKAVMYQPVSYGFKDVDDYEERELKQSQYTGRKDKNGREMYEGDIVNNEDNETAVIVYDSGSFILQYPDSPLDFDSLFDFQDKELEIIGNIYENPELLEVENG
ncbi:YopX family protein [Aneurinibacillus thermoaerophilus]|uniref:YopX family protein n=1 Tax=Aneurinibacillus thermoaerophilus TaxID=143495 RepID=UPI002E1B0112|nr:YopX family protein [Aneurinibacillus thermoaerophilus]